MASSSQSTRKSVFGSGKIEPIIARVVSKEYPPTGAGIGRTSYELVESLKRLGKPVDVVNEITLSEETRPAYRRTPLFNQGILGTYGFWKQAIRYACSANRPSDFLWLHQPSGPPWVFRKHLSNYGRRVIITWHSTYFGWKKALLEARPSLQTITYYTVCSKFESSFVRSLKLFENVVFTGVSPHICDELRQQGGEDTEVTFIPNGLPDIANLDLDPRHTTRKKFGLPSNATIIVYVGSLTPIKQPLRILQAYKVIREVDPSTILIIIGSGPLYPLMKRIAASRKDIVFFGHLDRLTILNILKASDLFISFSLYEGLSNAELEAASCGLPLLLSDIPSHRDLRDLQMAMVVLMKNKGDLDHKEVEEAYDKAKSIKTLGKMDCMDSGRKSDYAWQGICQRYLRLAQA